MSDLIDRDAAIEALKRAETITKAFGYHNVIDTIRELSSVQPEPKKGRWIKMSDADRIYYCCSRCGEEGNRTRFCPNCGAKMEGDPDETD